MGIIMMGRLTAMGLPQRGRGTILIAVVAALMQWLVYTEALASDHGGCFAGHYESKFYGTVESMPQNLVGIWVVNGRKIVVTKETRINEKHGRAVPGAFVEVEGGNTAAGFNASEIKVKRAKRH